MRYSPLESVRRIAPQVMLLTTVFAGVFTLVMGLSMDRGVSHDEGQHLAAGVLIGREGLLPYKDFPYLHTPYLPFVYAAIFQFTSHYLLAARLVSVFCTAVTGLLLFWTAWRLLRKAPVRWSWAIPFGILVLFLCNPLFIEGTGLAWNQDPSVLCALIATLLFLRGFREKRRAWWLFVCGVALGIAVGLRITVAPLAGGFLLLILWPADGRMFGTRVRSAAAFTAGLGVACLPMLVLFCMAPEQFLFGTFEFARFNVIYRFATGEPRTMTAFTKLRFFVKEVLRPSWPLVLALGGALWIFWRTRGQRPLRSFILPALLVLIVFALAGSFAPSPVFLQYFYVAVPFVLLVIMYVLAAIQEQPVWLRRAGVALAVLSFASLFPGAKPYDDTDELLTPYEWTPNEQRQIADEVRRLVGTEGEVLTLSPMAPLEGGLDIYPQLSTGPFAWRVAPFIDEDRRERLGIISQDDLARAMAPDAPEAILTGREKRWEEPLNAFAKARQYRYVRLSNGQRLWLSPWLGESH